MKNSNFNKDNIGFGFMGNGQVVWDRTIHERGDYKKVAHVQGKANEPVKEGEPVEVTLFTSQLPTDYTIQLKAYLSTFYSIKKFTTHGHVIHH
jgi:hypothetical protein